MKQIWKVAAVFGVIFGALSVVVLARQGIEFGFVAPLRAMLDWYDGAISAVLSPLQPAIESSGRAIGRLFSLDLHLQEGWQHVLTSSLVVGGATLRGVPAPIGFWIAGAIVLGGITGMFDHSFAPSAFGVPPSLSALLGMSLLALAYASFQETRIVLGLAKSLGIVFGGAILFVALNAGLDLAGF